MSLLAFTNLVQIRLIEIEYGICRDIDKEELDKKILNTCKDKERCIKIREILDKNEEKLKDLINKNNKVTNELLDFVLNDLEILSCVRDISRSRSKKDNN